MNLDKLLDFAWSIAEVEARALGSEVIEPIHFAKNAGGIL